MSAEQANELVLAGQALPPSGAPSKRFKIERSFKAPHAAAPVLLQGANAPEWKKAKPVRSAFNKASLARR